MALWICVRGRLFLEAILSHLVSPSGSLVNRSWFALDVSRGFESPEAKVYMRLTALVSDSLIYVPAILLFARVWLANRSARTQVPFLMASR